MGITHAKHSEKSDGSDTSLVLPSDWNADHVVSGIGMVLLEQHMASSSASLDFTSFISSTYDEYEFHLVGIVPATNLVDFYIRVSTDGGSSYDSGNNYVNNIYLVATSGNAGVGATLGAFVVRNAAEIGNGSAYGLAGKWTLYDPGSTTLVKRAGGNIRWSGNAAYNQVNAIMDGYWTTSGTAVNAVRFLFSSGNIASGTIRVYGIPK